MKQRLHRILNTTLARNAGWSFLGQGLSVLVQACYSVVIARLLEQTNYGIYTAAYAFVAIVSQYSALGAGFVFLRYVSIDRTRSKEFLGHILMTTLGLGSVLVMALGVLGPMVLSKVSAPMIIFIAIGDTIGQQLISTISQVFQTFERLKVMAALNVCVNVLRLALAFAMLIVLTHASAYQWAVASMTITVVAAIYIVVRVCRAYGPPKFHFRNVLSYWAEGFTFSLTGSTTSIYNDLDKVMLGHFGMNAANGIYSMAYKVLNVATTPIYAIHNAAFPRFFQLGANGVGSAEPFARKILKKTLLISVAAAVGMFVTAPLIPHFVGAGFAESVSALRWLCLIPVFRCFHVSAGDAMAGSGYQRYRLFTRIGASVLNFGLNLLLIPKYSWLGAAWASLATDGGLGLTDWITIRWLVSVEKKNKDAPALEFA